MSILNRVRAKAWQVIDRPGKLGDVARSMNDTLGRPLASEAELSDRAHFAVGYRPAHEDAPKDAAGVDREPAPVIIYTLTDGKRRDELPRIKQILDDYSVPYKVMVMDDDPAALAAVKRDANMKPPVVFIAGDAIGGREAVVNLGRDAVRKRVFGG